MRRRREPRIQNIGIFCFSGFRARRFAAPRNDRGGYFSNPLVFDRQAGGDAFQGPNELDPLFPPDETIEITLVGLRAGLELPHRFPAERRDFQGIASPVVRLSYPGDQAAVAQLIKRRRQARRVSPHRAGQRHLGQTRIGVDQHQDSKSPWQRIRVTNPAEESAKGSLVRGPQIEADGIGEKSEVNVIAEVGTGSGSPLPGRLVPGRLIPGTLIPGRLGGLGGHDETLPFRIALEEGAAVHVRHAIGQPSV